MKSIILVGQPLPPQSEKNEKGYLSKDIAHYVRGLLEDNIEFIKASFDKDDTILVDPFTLECYGSKWVGGSVDSLDKAIKLYPMKKSS